VFSLNVPVPADVARFATELAADLPAARPRARGDHTLIVKRLGDDSGLPRLTARIREQIRGQPPFQVRVRDIGLFREAAAGPSPVVYLAVESPELMAIHRNLAATFDAVEGIEGVEYVPHVTIARGGSVEAADRLAGRSIDPITWTATELVVWDADRDLPATRLSLPV